MCSYGFATTRSLRITNTSEIYLHYKTRVVCEDSDSSEEFHCTPSSGEIKAFQSGFVRVNFTPIASKKYLAKLYVDITHVGEGVAVLPMTAEAVVPLV